MDYKRILDTVLADIYDLSNELTRDFYDLANAPDGTQELTQSFLNDVQRLEMLLEFASILAPKIKDILPVDHIKDNISIIESYADEEYLYGEDDEWIEFPEEDDVFPFPAGSSMALSDMLVYPLSEGEVFNAICEEDKFDPKDEGRCKFYMQMLDIR